MNQSEGETQDGRFSFLADPSNWPLFYHTAKNMKARQLAGIAERQARHAVIPRLPIDFNRRYEKRIPNRLIVTPTPISANSELIRNSLSTSERDRYRNLVGDALKGKLTFLNRTINFGDEIDWNHELLEEYPLLWRLKLQSFEFLEWAVLGFEDPSEEEEIHERFQRWFLSWAESNPIGDNKYLRRSWIPHSVSLRIINWCRYVAWCEERDMPVPESLYHQIFKNSLFLDNHIEWDVGGNHLVENSTALIMAGVLFQNQEKDWVQKGMNILSEVAETQFLADGGHFERSPMYHIMVLMRYLTSIHLLSHLNTYTPPELDQVTRNGVKYLRSIQAPDGRIPLLNDAVFEEVESPEACLNFAERIGKGAPEFTPQKYLEGSGYYWLGSGDTRMLVDGGAVGPPHLPGHSHNDQLSINLWVEGKPFIIDTGTFDYSLSERRIYSRSIAAHSTVQVNEIEPIRIGGQYLMGKRNQPRVNISHKGSKEMFDGRIKRTTPFINDYIHKRNIEYENGQFNITDTIKGENFTSRFHFHPEICICSKDDRTFIAKNSDTKLKISINNKHINPSIQTSEYYPEFGKCKMRPCLTLEGNEHQSQYKVTMRYK